MDGWTDLARRIRERVFSLPADQFTPENMMAAFEDSDFEKMEEIRARVDSIVADPDTAANLKAWYRQLCKRPCFHDEYLQAFNRPNAHLVDTDGQGRRRGSRRRASWSATSSTRSTASSTRRASRSAPTYTRRAGYDMVGRDGRPPVRRLGRGDAHQARHPRPRLPQRLLRADRPGRQPGVERAPQLHRGGHDHRPDRAARHRRRPRRSSRSPGGRGRLDGAAAVRARPSA